MQEWVNHEVKIFFSIPSLNYKPWIRRQLAGGRLPQSFMFLLTKQLVCCWWYDIESHQEKTCVFFLKCTVAPCFTWLIVSSSSPAPNTTTYLINSAWSFNELMQHDADSHMHKEQSVGLLLLRTTEEWVSFIIHVTTTIWITPSPYQNHISKSFYPSWCTRCNEIPWDILKLRVKQMYWKWIKEILAFDQV